MDSRWLAMLLVAVILAPASAAFAQGKPDPARAKKDAQTKKLLLDMLPDPSETPPPEDILGSASEADLEQMRRSMEAYEPCRGEIAPPDGSKWQGIALVADGPKCELVEAAKSARAELAACYDALVGRRPEAEGALTLRFGPKASLKISEREGLDRAAEKCVLGALREKAPEAARGTLSLSFGYFGSSGAVAPGK